MNSKPEKTLGRARLRIGCAAPLLTAGCAPSIPLSDKVEVEFQVRDPEGRAVPGAFVQVEIRSPWPPTSARRSLPWLREGCEPLVLHLDSRQFIGRGARLRRMEAVSLRKAAP